MPDNSPAPMPHIEASSGEDSHRTKGLVRLTMACNERCLFCNVPMEDYSRLTPPHDHVLAQLDDLIESGGKTLTISGGEPTLLRARLLQLISTATARGIPFVDLQTNAVLIDNAYAAALAKAGLTSAFVSLLSHQPAHHDQLAGLDGAFDRCLRGIDALLAHNIRVTLNPVTARQTQALLPDYVDFVATRLPGVRFLSLSAVQPHGRAAANPEGLLPDYDILADAVKEARIRAQKHGIEVINPYCGLPICVGWSDDISRSVEAFEATHGGWRHTTGLDNTGNKQHGAPCQPCALRTRCGGAWNLYWTLRDGRGIHAPLTRVEPWFTHAQDTPGQAIARGSVSQANAALAACREPTCWWYTDAVVHSDLSVLDQGHITDIGLRIRTFSPDQLQPTLRALQAIAHDNAKRLPQQQIKLAIAIEIHDAMRPATILRLGARLLKIGIDSLRFIHADTRWSVPLDQLASRFPDTDISLISTDLSEP